MNFQSVLINVDELWLKGKNRALYYQALFSHIRQVLKATGVGEFKLKNFSQRIVAECMTGIELESITCLQKIPGIFSIQPAIRLSREDEFTSESVDDFLTRIFLKAAQLVEIKLSERQSQAPLSFKVFTTRSDKRFSMTSMEISSEIGARLLTHFGEKLVVDIRSPELKVGVKVLPQLAFINTDTFRGIGGLPWGMNGHLVTLLSGGFDSPVASYLMSKRGCEQTFVFFYAYPFVGDEVKEKIVKMMTVLGRYQKGCKLYIIPFGEMQQQIAKSCREEYRTLLFRRSMVDVANRLAEKIGADALLTGDALGQVSSQTIGNISLLDSFSSLPIFRPLVGFNKREIITLAEKIGSHDISVIPHDDACSLFAPKHPIIKPDKFYLKRYNEEISLEAEIDSCIARAEIFSVDVIGQVKPFEQDF